MNNAIDGEEGGNGAIIERAASVASLSTPAKTVTKELGTFSLSKENLTPGLAFAAAQPQTEFTTTKVVPSALIAASIVYTSLTCLKPTAVNSSRIGCTNSAGYIIIFLLVQR